MRKDIKVKKPFYNTAIYAFPSIWNKLHATDEDRQFGQMALRFHL
jgi:hypothetical protein